jgi:hypothetical protein
VKEVIAQQPPRKRWIGMLNVNDWDYMSGTNRLDDTNEELDWCTGTADFCGRDEYEGI